MLPYNIKKDGTCERWKMHINKKNRRFSSSFLFFTGSIQFGFLSLLYKLCVCMQYSCSIDFSLTHVHTNSVGCMSNRSRLLEIIVEHVWMHLYVWHEQTKMCFFFHTDNVISSVMLKSRLAKSFEILNIHRDSIWICDTETNNAQIANN